MIIFKRTLGKGEVNSTYLNLTDDDGEPYGPKLGLNHKEKLVIIDGLGRRTRAQMHHENQIWGSLRQWYEDNPVEPGDVIEVKYNPNEFEDGLRVIRIIPKQITSHFETLSLEESHRDSLSEKVTKVRNEGETGIHAPRPKKKLRKLNATKVFNSITSDLHSLLRDAQDQGSQAFQDQDFKKVQVAAEYGEEILAIIEAVEKLQKSWPSLLKGLSKPKKRKKRLSPGVKTQEGEFLIPILQALDKLGGKASVQDVLDQVEDMMKDRLKSVDYQILSDGRSIRWRNAAQWARKSMVKDGLLVSNSPRGIWEISSTGREYLTRQSSSQK